MPHPLAETRAAVRELFAARGFPLVQHVDGPGDGVFDLYKGPRKQLTGVAASPNEVTVSTDTVGSWFAARFLPVQGGVEVTLWGKPTLDGHEMCADADGELAEVKYWCTDTKVSDQWYGLRETTGREEGETITAVLADMAAKLGATQVAGLTFSHAR